MCLLIVTSCGGLVFLLPKQFQDLTSEVVVSKTASTPNPIAVLAFDNYYSQVKPDYFAGGLAKEIFNFLADTRELNIAVHRSSFRFQGEKADVCEIANLLGVEHIFKGSVRRDGNRIRITV